MKSGSGSRSRGGTRVLEEAAEDSEDGDGHCLCFASLRLAFGWRLVCELLLASWAPGSPSPRCHSFSWALRRCCCWNFFGRKLLVSASPSLGTYFPHGVSDGALFPPLFGAGGVGVGVRTLSGFCIGDGKDGISSQMVVADFAPLFYLSGSLIRI
ncbi:hypothetical protein SUGI_1028420 [Cryptomeria japonica]|nr:hypothetical protein SUGI_1028420 [Cryptomeria japonica]